LPPHPAAVPSSQLMVSTSPGLPKRLSFVPPSALSATSASRARSCVTGSHAGTSKVPVFACATVMPSWAALAALRSSGLSGSMNVRASAAKYRVPISSFVNV
jgi:hypothetical protein